MIITKLCVVEAAVLYPICSLNKCIAIKYDSDLGGIGIPNINVMIVWASDEQAGVNGIPYGCGDGIFVGLLVLLVNDK